VGAIAPESVRAVTDLGVARIVVRIAVVAVAGALELTVAVVVGLLAAHPGVAGVVKAVAIVVQPVADLGARRSRGRVARRAGTVEQALTDPRRLALSQAGGAGIPQVGEIFVGLGVAVVVESVAPLRCAGIDIRVVVVAIVGREHAVAVVVDAEHCLRCVFHTGRHRPRFAGALVLRQDRSRAQEHQAECQGQPICDARLRVHHCQLLGPVGRCMETAKTDLFGFD
jgi:hypothetical protein